MFIVIHLYGGLLESVSLNASLPDAQVAIAQAIPNPCNCDGDCMSYQEAFIYQAEILGQAAVSVESRHSPSKHR